MKLILDLSIACDDPKYVYAMVRKELETDLVPMVGMQLEDSAWKEPRPIEHLTINPTEGYYLIQAGREHGKNQKDCEQLKKMYHVNGWTGLEVK